jgi:predicted anti-sigma-YlaC factor YlaD
MDIDLLIHLKERRAKGLLTGTGYLLAACEILQVEIATVDRVWLASQVGMTYKATQGTIDRLRAKGLI